LPVQLQISGTARIRPGEITAPDQRHGPQSGPNVHRHIEARIDVTDIDVVTGQHQPPVAQGRRDVREPERDDGAPGRQSILVHIAVHVPEQQLRIQLAIAQLADPARPPHAERLDNRTQLLTRVGEHVAHT
jgi:hypothetical protein